MYGVELFLTRRTFSNRFFLTYLPPNTSIYLIFLSFHFFFCFNPVRFHPSLLSIFIYLMSFESHIAFPLLSFTFFPFLPVVSTYIYYLLLLFVNPVLPFLHSSIMVYLFSAPRARYFLSVSFASMFKWWLLATTCRSNLVDSAGGEIQEFKRADRTHRKKGSTPPRCWKRFLRGRHCTAGLLYSPREGKEMHASEGFTQYITIVGRGLVLLLVWLVGWVEHEAKKVIIRRKWCNIYGN